MCMYRYIMCAMRRFRLIGFLLSTAYTADMGSGVNYSVNDVLYNMHPHFILHSPLE